MLATAIVLFLFAGVFGLIVLLTLFKNHPTPKPVVVIHGVLGGIALLITLTYLAMGHTEPLFLTGTGLLLAAVVIGFIAFGIDISGMRVPRWLVIIHPLLAVAGVIVLLFFLEKMS